MTPGYVWPPRHARVSRRAAPTPGTSSAGSRRADGGRGRWSWSPALRATVEDSGDHEAGLVRVRRSLDAVGRSAGPGWSASYYGKDLVLVGGEEDERAAGIPEPAGLDPAGGVRHGWAWDRLVLEGDAERRRDALLRACYAVSMAARLRRDRPALPHPHAGTVLGLVPQLLPVTGAAALLAGVLVRPWAPARRSPGPGRGGPAAAGVPSADGLPPPARTGGAGGGFHVVTDVHDIEWGTLRDGRRLTEGNARQMLSLAGEWLAGARTPEDVVRLAYPLRLGREASLVGHLRTLSDAAAAGVGSSRPSGTASPAASTVRRCCGGPWNWPTAGAPGSCAAVPERRRWPVRPPTEPAAAPTSACTSPRPSRAPGTTRRISTSSARRSAPARPTRPSPSSPRCRTAARGAADSTTSGTRCVGGSGGGRIFRRRRAAPSTGSSPVGRAGCG
ncbi:hypothetical protein NKH77_28370 [Streptomyces sp. M19]